MCHQTSRTGFGDFKNRPWPEEMGKDRDFEVLLQRSACSS